MTVVCDYATVSTPLDNGPALFDALAGLVLECDGAVTDRNGVQVGHGRLHYSERRDAQVATISASGALLAALRGMERLVHYCATIAAHAPYKVTHLDLAHDVQADAPTELVMLYERLRVTGCALSRKRTPAGRIVAMMSRGLDGRDTGTVFVGNRKSAETTAAVYDRQQDARAKGKDDPGKLLRYEIRTGVAGMSLKDVVVPDPLFYHFAAPDLLPRPAHVPDWQPWGEGFSVPATQFDPMQRLVRLVERSTDVDRMLQLADQVPGGLETLRRLLNQRLRLHQATVAFTAGHATAEARVTRETPVN